MGCSATGVAGGREPDSTAAGDRDGEADAISYAKENGIADVLMDEKAGRKVAAAAGLHVLPTLAILESADRAGLLDFVGVIERIRRTTFRLPAIEVEAALLRVSKRKSNPGITPP